MSFEKPHFNYAINGFRGVCILMVFIYHFENSRIIPWAHSLGALWPAILYFFSSFRYGVEAFFMISGYVIVGSLRRHGAIKAFFTDRALRLYPAWIPLHLIIFFLGPLIAHKFFGPVDTAHWITDFFADLLFLTPAIFPASLAHPAAWSLSYELLFYILAASTVVLAHSRLGKLNTGIMIAAAALALINLYPRGLFFIPGVIAAFYEKEIETHARFFRFPLVALLLFLLAWRATGVDRAELDTMLIEWLHDSRIFYALLAFCAGTYGFACIVAGAGRFGQTLRISFMQFYGKISYSFYLWSPIVMFPVKRVAMAFVMPVAGPWGAVACFAAFSLLFSTIISWLSWRYIEKELTQSIRKYLDLRKQPLRSQTAGA